MRRRPTIMQFTHRFGLSTAVVAIACALAACGGVDDGSDAQRATGTTTTTLTTGDPVIDDVTGDAPPNAEPDDADDQTAPPSSEPTDTAPPPMTSTPPSTSTGATQQPESESELVEAAVADLAATEARDPADIELVSFERVNWRDGSLGCPEPGFSYTQAIVRGYRIVLSLDGSIVEYHGAAGGPPLFCADPQDPAPGNDRSDA